MKKIVLLFLLFLYGYSCSSQLISRIESVQSLYIEVYKDNIKLGSATGFLIRSKTRNYLVTNFHVVTNKKPTDFTWLDPLVPVSPNKIAIVHNGKKLG